MMQIKGKKCFYKLPKQKNLDLKKKNVNTGNKT